MKYLIAVMLLVLFSVSTVYALDETDRCDLGGYCDFTWPAVNNSNKSQYIDWPCNITISDPTNSNLFSVLATIRPNKWQNVSMPTVLLGYGHYSVEGLCNGTLFGFGFEVNTTLATLTYDINVTLENVSVSVNTTNIGEAIWNYDLTNHTGNSSGARLMRASESGEIWFALVIMIVAGLYWWLVFNMNGEFRILQILFVFMGLYMIIFGFGFMMGLANTWGYTDGFNLMESMYFVTIILLVVMVFMLLIQIIMNLYRILSEGKIELW